MVRFLNLGSDEVIVPGTANLSFNIELSSERTLVRNIGRAIGKKLAVKFEGNEILIVDDFDVFACYRDLWKADSEKRNAVRQGIIHSDGCMLNCMKLRINAESKDATNAQDDVIAKAYGNTLIIPLDFEMLVQCHVTNRDSETDCVMKLLSTITEKLSMHQDKHHPQMLHIRLQILP